jgi:hypothetical protein
MYMKVYYLEYIADLKKSSQTPSTNKASRFNAWRCFPTLHIQQLAFAIKSGIMASGSGRERERMHGYREERRELFKISRMYSRFDPASSPGETLSEDSFRSAPLFHFSFF